MPPYHILVFKSETIQVRETIKSEIFQKTGHLNHQDRERSGTPGMKDQDMNLNISNAEVCGSSDESMVSYFRSLQSGIPHRH